ncbi:hypothetical protein [Burkholderia lata]|uniref:hypothetical protein n=1 Tax=Burkholderia lata (strain ATCC 17760 / DSM 23089 / LMG 22485 / NCIMB 9086 / R18194 / 383) TaxID=482957 RepID=UPI0005A2D992|nr:hypothetical protein [Burkholderia lata]
MLECALAQGDGDAAEEPGFAHERPQTAEAKRRALVMVHEGVRPGKVLLLPPALLPKRDGNTKTLIDTVPIANRQT